MLTHLDPPRQQPFGGHHLMGELVQFPRALKSVAPDDEIEDTHIYLIANGVGHIKIGVSANPAKRLATLQGANATPLRLLHVTNAFPRWQALRIERLLHEHLNEFAAGHEWFAITRLQALNAIIGLRAEFRETAVTR